MNSKECPCSLSALPLGDSRREPILDCVLGKDIPIMERPCMKLTPPHQTVDNIKPRKVIVQGAERHTSEGFDPFGVSHPTPLA